MLFVITCVVILFIVSVLDDKVGRILQVCKTERWVKTGYEEIHEGSYESHRVAYILTALHVINLYFGHIDNLTLELGQKETIPHGCNHPVS